VILQKIQSALIFISNLFYENLAKLIL